ncbi:MAG: hypothetical protein HRU40_15345 [Saprospiraceae bacterium]|nr:hypothetical protein [Saprospiraceae bacterium]
MFSVIVLVSSGWTIQPEWGFFGHRRINRLAVFTLPPEMIGFYKKNIEYITEHAVDPDKRRYATRHEAVRHYIDIDHWGTFPFDNVPRNWPEAIRAFAEVQVIDALGDTLKLITSESIDYTGQYLRYIGTDSTIAELWERNPIALNAYQAFFNEYVMPQYYEDEWQLDCSLLSEVLGLETDCQSVRIIDHFSAYGILPYHLVHFQEQLTQAFRAGNLMAILRLSAEMGHYVGDGHVPLHTTENYNGELTNQRGIHAFWESRIPELFADAQYDPFVGRATYIADPVSFYWDVVLTSHQLVDSVLVIEREIAKMIPLDQQYCFEERLGRTVRVECRAYASAYQESMRGMVESRWRASIRTIGSAWYTAWVDAGQPNLEVLKKGITPEESAYFKSLENAFRQGESKGRPHSGE